MNSNTTNIHAPCNPFFQGHWKMLHSRNKTLESLVEKYKGPGYCISRYHGNADVCFNVRNLI